MQEGSQKLKILEIIVLILTVFTVTSCNVKQVDNRYANNSPNKARINRRETGLNESLDKSSRTKN